MVGKYKGPLAICACPVPSSHAFRGSYNVDIERTAHRLQVTANVLCIQNTLTLSPPAATFIYLIGKRQSCNTGFILPSQ